MIKYLISAVALVGLSPIHAATPWDMLEKALNAAPEEVSKQLEQVLLEHPGFHAAHYNYGCILLGQDNQVKASQHFRQAMTSPDDQLAGNAALNLALALHGQGRLEEAMQACHQGLKRLPKDTELAAAQVELERLLLIQREEARQKAEEEAKRLRLESKELKPSWVEKSYHDLIKAAGGSGGPYQFSVAKATPLPTGLNLAPNGIISGKPDTSAVGTHTITIHINDNGATANGDVTLTVHPSPAILTEQIPEALADTPYQARIEAEGFINPQWDIQGLPEGLSFRVQQDSVYIDGNTNSHGSHTLTVSCKDAYHERSKELNLQVSKDGFLPDVQDMPPATQWRPYTFQLGVRGPDAHYTWQGDTDSNTAFAISSIGLVTGTAEEAGEVPLTFRIIKDGGEQRGFSIPIPVNEPPVINQEQAITLRIGTPAQQQLSVQGGTAPFTWEAIDLPPEGIELNEHGFLTGTAEHIGEYTCNIRVTDRWGAHAEAEIRIDVKEHEDPNQQQDQPNQEGDQQQQGEQEPGDQSQGQDGQQQSDSQQQNQNEQDGQGQQQQQLAQNESNQSEERQDQGQRTQAAALRKWLDDLPDENQQPLQYQLLLDPEQSNSKNQQPW